MHKLSGMRILVLMLVLMVLTLLEPIQLSNSSIWELSLMHIMWLVLVVLSLLGLVQLNNPSI